MTGHRAAALRAFAKLWSMPAVSRFARAQPHLGRFAFGDSHVSRERKQGILKIQMAFGMHCRQAGDSVIDQTLEISLPIVFVWHDELGGRTGAAKITGGLTGAVGNETRSESEENSQARRAARETDVAAPKPNESDNGN